jgi:hypothetical protein
MCTGDLHPSEKMLEWRQWSGFFEGAESILEKRLAKQLLLMDKRMNCP